MGYVVFSYNRIPDMQTLEVSAEYQKGNYCVCGGDFNHDFTGDSTLVLGGGDFTLSVGGFTLGGIGTATFGAIILNALMSIGERKKTS